MRSLVVIALLAVAVLACGDADERAAVPAARPATDLRVEVTGAGPDPVVVDFRCGEGVGACDQRRLQGLAGAIASAEDDKRACTQVFGGPERAHVTGTLRGQTVDVQVARSTGCGIADYEALFEALGRRPPLKG